MLVALQAPHQFRETDSESLRDEGDVPQRQVSLPSLDPTHVGPVQTAFGSERFLGQTFGPSQFSDSLSEAFEDVDCFAHALKGEQQPPFGPRAMSIIRDWQWIRFRDAFAADSGFAGDGPHLPPVSTKSATIPPERKFTGDHVATLIGEYHAFGTANGPPRSH